VFFFWLNVKFMQVREQAIWALGNIAGDSAQWRDFVLSLDAMSLL
jgi:importin subunit alpha-1